MIHQTTELSVVLLDYADVVIPLLCRTLRHCQGLSHQLLHPKGEGQREGVVGGFCFFSAD